MFNPTYKPLCPGCRKLISLSDNQTSLMCIVYHVMYVYLSFVSGETLRHLNQIMDIVIRDEKPNITWSVFASYDKNTKYRLFGLRSY